MEKISKFLSTVLGRGQQKKDNLIPITFQYDDEETTIVGTKLDFDFLVGKPITIPGTKYRITETRYNINENKYTAKCMKGL